jgi:signal transduction histidine kinase
VRLVGPAGLPGAALIVPLEVLPPWHRTWPAYALYGSILLLAAFGAIRWSGQLARKRNHALEQLVGERTRQLESTMSRLNEETRVTATLAERNRLAGEIHDSVQQGLSGAILQLDTTLTLPIATGNLRNRLNVVRNMVSYARQEVQHAIWDMESPLLQGNDLGEALRRLAILVTSGKIAPQVEVSGNPVPLPRGTMHHLLRIAQEATTNAARHAQAREITVRLEYQSDAVMLAITDDGVGFHPDAVLNQTGHFGLRGIRTRTKKLNASLTITSARNEGTAIHILVPHHSRPSDDQPVEDHHSAPNPHSAG